MFIYRYNDTGTDNEENTNKTAFFFWQPNVSDIIVSL